MLGDQDRHALEDIERGLAVDDPGFAARMSGGGEERPLPVILLLSMVLYVTMPIAVLLFGRTGAVVTLVVFAVGVLVALMRRHLHPR